MYISALDNLENSIRTILDSVALYSDNLYIDNLVELDNMRSGMEDTGKKKELSSDFKTIEF